MVLREMCCKEGRYKEIGEDSVQWWVFVLSLLYFQVIIPESHFFRAEENTIYSATK